MSYYKKSYGKFVLKIIFLIDANFSKREYERFGFYEMLNEKIEVQVFDFRKLRKGGELTGEGFEKDGFDKRVKRFNITKRFTLSSYPSFSKPSSEFHLPLVNLRK